MEMLLTILELQLRCSEKCLKVLNVMSYDHAGWNSNITLTIIAVKLLVHFTNKTMYIVISAENFARKADVSFH